MSPRPLSPTGEKGLPWLLLIYKIKKGDLKGRPEIKNKDCYFLGGAFWGAAFVFAGFGSSFTISSSSTSKIRAALGGILGPCPRGP